MSDKSFLCNYNGEIINFWDNNFTDVLNCIYMMRNIESPDGKIYVGKSVSLKRRMREHYRNAVIKGKNECPFLNNAIRKYGWLKFEITILVSNVCDNDTLLTYEKLFVDLLDSINNGYNVQNGGIGGYNYTNPSIYSVSKYANPVQYHKERYALHRDEWLAQQKKHRDANSEVINERKRKSWRLNADKLNAKRRERYKNNPEYKRKIDERNKRNAKKNADKLKEYHSNYYQQHKEEIKQRVKDRYYREEYDGKSYVREMFNEMNKGKKEGYWIEEGEKIYMNGKTRLRVMRRTISSDEKDLEWIFRNYQNICEGGKGVMYNS